MCTVVLRDWAWMVRPMRHGRAMRREQMGLAYLGVLFLVFLMSIGLGKTMEMYSTAQQRLREDELLHVGHAYRMAIKSYYDGSPTAKQYPNNLNELLADGRFPVIKRHLRQLYPDPVTGKPFGLIRSTDGKIVGVRSLSKRAPFRSEGFPAEYHHFAQAKTFDSWEFAYHDES